MGFRFRKSIKLGGGFRINLSKSGIGYSWGVPGYRITKTATGRTRNTYSIPGTGLSYIQESNTCPKRKDNLSKEKINFVANEFTNIESAEIDNFVSEQYQEVINQISKMIKLNKFSNWLLVSLILSHNPVFLVLSLIGVAIKIYIYNYGKVVFHYNFDEYSKEKYENESKAWLSLNNAKGLWQIIQTASVINQKSNAGASKNINTISIKVLKKTPFYLKTNVDVFQINLKKENLIILPDKIIVMRDKKIGIIDYKDINIKVSPVEIVEVNQVPSDAKIVNYTWLYVNKDGTPDKRYKDNPQFPICLYGNIYITSTNGLNVHLQCSNFEIVKKFGETFNKI